MGFSTAAMKAVCARPACPSLLILGRVRHATSGTRAAQMATNPKAIPVAVMYARMVRSPPRLGQNGDCASMTL